MTSSPGSLTIPPCFAGGFPTRPAPLIHHALYKSTAPALQAAYRVLLVSLEHGKLILSNLARIASLPDDVARRIVLYMAQSVGRAEQVRRWLNVFTKRQGIQSGVAVNRAVKEALEGVPEMAESLQDELNDVVVAAANFANSGNGTGLDNVVATFAEKYRSAGGAGRLEGALSRMRGVAQSGSISDEIVARTIRSLAGSDVPALTDDAVEGALTFMTRAGDDIPLAEREATLTHLLVGTEQESETLMRFIRNSTGDETAQGLARMYRRIPCPAP